uniref:X-box-binding protein 1 n=1 Tax=Dracunculus medinensis TaxID=318479 RepID=A0A0N4UJS4_DRAME
LHCEVEKLIGNKSTSTATIRRRERLTHLTAEEKQNRRKLKNRVAAQTARDRKKERTFKLEQALRLLCAENKSLREENQSIKVKLLEAEKRNGKLEEKLKRIENERKNEMKSVDYISGAFSVESAEFINEPQQRAQVMLPQVLIPLLIMLIALIYKASWTNYLNQILNLTNSVNKFSTKKVSPFKIHHHHQNHRLKFRMNMIMQKLLARTKWKCRKLLTPVEQIALPYIFT